MITLILTYTGKLIELGQPDPERIDLRDVSHALARVTRFTGHGDRSLSVAQHSCIVHDLAPVECKRWALLHDAAEAYTGDISSPVKEVLRRMAPQEFDVWLAAWQFAVSIRFGVPIVDVHAADQAALELEVVLNGPRSSAEYRWLWPEWWATQAARTTGCADTVWPAELAEFEFLRRARELGLR